MEEDKWEFDAPKFWDFTGSVSQTRPDESWFCEANISGPSFPTKKKRRPLRMFNTAEKSKQLKPPSQDSQPKRNVFDRLSRMTTISASKKSTSSTNEPRQLEKSNELQKRQKQDILEPPHQTVSERISQFEQNTLNNDRNADDPKTTSQKPQPSPHRSLFDELNAYHSRASINSFKEKMNVFDDDHPNDDDSILSIESFRKAIAKEKPIDAESPLRTMSTIPPPSQQQEDEPLLSLSERATTPLPTQDVEQSPSKQKDLFNATNTESPLRREPKSDLENNYRVSNHSTLDDPFDSSPIITTSKSKSSIAITSHIQDKKNHDEPQDANQKSRSVTPSSSNTRFRTRMESYDSNDESSPSKPASNDLHSKQETFKNTQTLSSQTVNDHTASPPHSSSGAKPQALKQSIKPQNIPLSSHRIDLTKENTPISSRKPLKDIPSSSRAEPKSPLATRTTPSSSSQSYNSERLSAPKLQRNYSSSSHDRIYTEKEPSSSSSQNNVHNQTGKASNIPPNNSQELTVDDMKGKKREDSSRKPSNTSTLSLLAGVRAPIVARHTHLTYNTYRPEPKRSAPLTIHEVRAKCKEIRRQIRQLKEIPVVKERPVAPAKPFSKHETLEKARQVLEASKELFNENGKRRHVVDVETTVANARKLLEESRKKQKKRDFLQDL